LLSHNLASLHHTLLNAQPHLANAHVYPLPSFPGREQENLLGQLLRKKLQPQVEDWIVAGERHEQQQQQQEQQQQDPLTAAQLADLWNWAGPEGNRVARDLGADAFDDVFTLEEHELGIETIVTGLRRKLWESDDEDEQDEDDTKEESKKADTSNKQDTDMLNVPDTTVVTPDHVRRLHRHNIDPSKPPMSIEHILRFALTAREPPTVVQ
jgi:mediator of RNA polymerase II transcription subunit 8